MCDMLRAGVQFCFCPVSTSLFLTVFLCWQRYDWMHKWFMILSLHHIDPLFHGFLFRYVTFLSIPVFFLLYYMHAARSFLTLLQLLVLLQHLCINTSINVIKYFHAKVGPYAQSHVNFMLYELSYEYYEVRIQASDLRKILGYWDMCPKVGYG